MKTLVLGLVALLSLMGNSLQAQDKQITGTWQGLLKQGSRELRVVFTIAVENDQLTASHYSLDEGGEPIPVSAITHTGPAISMTLASLSSKFEGTLSADGNTISGTFTQLNPVHLTLTRTTKDTAWAIPDPTPMPRMLPDDAMPEFEVATINLSRPDERFAILLYPGGSLAATSASLSDLIRFAYNIHPRQLIGGPGWVDSEKYDVTGKPDTPGTPTIAQSQSMMRKLLAGRFALEFHREQREMSLYAIALAKGEPRLTASGIIKPLPSFHTSPNSIVALNATLAEFAQIVQANVLDQPVLDRTGLGRNRYSFTLRWTPDGTHSDDPDAPPDIFTAFERQLGLRLQLTRAAADVLIIDRVARPSAN